MKKIFVQLNYLLDKDDKIHLIKFLLLLFISSLISLIGIWIIIPFANILMNPQKNYVFHIFKFVFNYKLYIFIYSIILIISFIGKNILLVFISKRHYLFQYNLSTKLRKIFFYKYIHLPYINQSLKPTSGIISLINNEIELLVLNFIGQLEIVVKESVLSGMILIALIIINPLFFLILCLSYFLAMQVFIAFFKDKARSYGKIRIQNHRLLTSKLSYSMLNLKETKLYNKEDYFVKQINMLSDDYAHAGAFKDFFQQSFRFWIEMVAVSVIILTLVAFTLFGYSGQKLLILLSVFSVASFQLLPSMSRLVQGMSMIRFNYPLLSNIYCELKELNDEEVIVNNTNLNTKISFENFIELKNIYYKYSDKKILNNISLKIYKGQHIAFIGPSGAGKTTLIDMIMGILCANAGTISVDNILITNNNLYSWRKFFGYIPQNINIYGFSIRENIAFGVEQNDIDDNQVWRVLEIANLKEFVLSLPQKLSTVMTENGSNLSGGQRQRIGIARALYNNPEILVMDEASASLDEKTEKEVISALKEAYKHKTLLTIAHRLNTIKDYDKIFIIEDGQIVENVTYDSITRKNLN